MRLSEWRAAAPNKDAGSPKVAALVDPVITALGAEPDPHGWVVWGEEPGVRYSILLPIPAGLVSCFVRVNVPGEGPRASAKLVRWNRVEIGELAIETSAGHRLLSFQVEGYVLQGADDAADRIAAFALEMFAAIDGRPRPEPRPAPARARGTGVKRAAPPASASRRAGRGRATGAVR
jgi:hypothetical protein